MWNLTQKTRATQVEFVGWRFICDVRENSILELTARSVYRRRNVTSKSIKFYFARFSSRFYASDSHARAHLVSFKYWEITSPSWSFLARFQLKRELRPKLRDESISEKRSDA